MLFFLAQVALLSFGSYAIYQYNPNILKSAALYIDTTISRLNTKEVTTIYALNRPRKLKNCPKNISCETMYVPHLLVEIKVNFPDKPPVNQMQLWNMNDGEIIINSQPNIKKTKGLNEILKVPLDKNIYRIASLLSKCGHSVSLDKIATSLCIQRPIAQKCIENNASSIFYFKNGYASLLISDSYLPSMPETSEKNTLSVLSKSSVNKKKIKSAKYSEEQILNAISSGITGNNATVKNSEIVYIPITNTLIEECESVSVCTYYGEYCDDSYPNN